MSGMLLLLFFSVSFFVRYLGTASLQELKEKKTLQAVQVAF